MAQCAGIGESIVEKSEKRLELEPTNISNQESTTHNQESKVISLERKTGNLGSAIYNSQSSGFESTLRDSFSMSDSFSSIRDTSTIDKVIKLSSLPKHTVEVMCKENMFTGDVVECECCGNSIVITNCRVEPQRPAVKYLDICQDCDEKKKNEKTAREKKEMRELWEMKAKERREAREERAKERREFQEGRAKERKEKQEITACIRERKKRQNNYRRMRKIAAVAASIIAFGVGYALGSRKNKVK